MLNPAEVIFKPAKVQTRKGREVEIRAVGPQDFGALVRMYKTFEPKRVAQGLPPPDVPRIASWLDRLAQKSTALLAWEATSVVAHAILCPMPANSVEFTIFVHQDYRQEGLGTALSRLALEWATAMGFSKVYLTTETVNFRALRLFHKLGFKTTSSYGDELEMILHISGSEAACPQAA